MATKVNLGPGDASQRKPLGLLKDLANTWRVERSLLNTFGKLDTPTLDPHRYGN